MGPLDEAIEEDLLLPTDGLVVEEISDEDTVRQFVAAWRLRVSREYAMALLRQRPTQDSLQQMY